MNKEPIHYETVSDSGLTYTFNYNGSHVSVDVNGKLWGVPQGERFLLALLRDIQELHKESMTNNQKAKVLLSQE